MYHEINEREDLQAESDNNGVKLECEERFM